MFGDLDWPINASCRFVSISWSYCSLRRHMAPQETATSLVNFFASLKKDSVTSYALIWTVFSTTVKAKFHLASWWQLVANSLPTCSYLQPRWRTSCTTSELVVRRLQSVTLTVLIWPSFISRWLLTMTQQSPVHL